jgi:hypothetical protein
VWSFVARIPSLKVPPTHLARLIEGAHGNLQRTHRDISAGNSTSVVWPYTRASTLVGCRAPRPVTGSPNSSSARTLDPM